jgi:hypothetical protein
LAINRKRIEIVEKVFRSELTVGDIVLVLESVSGSTGSRSRGSIEVNGTRRGGLLSRQV